MILEAQTLLSMIDTSKSKKKTSNLKAKTKKQKTTKYTSTSFKIQKAKDEKYSLKEAEVGL